MNEETLRVYAEVVRVTAERAGLVFLVTVHYEESTAHTLAITNIDGRRWVAWRNETGRMFGEMMSEIDSFLLHLTEEIMFYSRDMKGRAGLERVIGYPLCPFLSLERYKNRCLTEKELKDAEWEIAHRSRSRVIQIQPLMPLGKTTVQYPSPSNKPCLIRP